MSKKIRVTLLSLFLALSFARTSAYAWDSREDVNTMDTHKTIAVQALEMIKNDMSTDIKLLNNLYKIQENIQSFKKGAVAPDFGDVGIDRDYYLYQDHFYDPDTGKNFTANGLYPSYEIPDTGESQTRNYIGQAIANWKDGNYSRSCYLLGKAMHYFGDMNEPHHASNLTGGPGTAHTKFETYAEEEKNKYILNSVGKNNIIYTENNNLRLDTYLTTQANKYGKMAKNASSLAGLSNTWDQWNEALDITLKNAQKGCASVIYRFLQEVTYPNNIPLTSPIGKLHVILTVADEYNAGTDDYIYIGFQLKNGRQIEFNCDLPGDDFTRNSTGCYQFNIDDSNINPKDINKVYIKKHNYLSDDVKFKNIEVYMQCKRVLKQEINQWMHGNTIYEINTNGLY